MDYTNFYNVGYNNAFSLAFSEIDDFQRMRKGSGWMKKNINGVPYGIWDYATYSNSYKYLFGIFNIDELSNSTIYEKSNASKVDSSSLV